MYDILYIYFMEKIKGLIAATYTPLNEDGTINYSQIPVYQEHMLKKDIRGFFINGSTGDFPGISIEERMKIIEVWSQIKVPGHKYIAHVGSNNINEARGMALHAETNGMDAISVLSPFYFKPKNVNSLVDFCAEIADRVSIPFYYYHIPSLTGVDLSMVEFLEKADKQIKNLAGIKYSKVDIIEFRKCVEFAGNKYDILFGSDENLLSAVSMGCQGAVGSTYNFIPGIYHEMLSAMEEGNLEHAAEMQSLSIKFVEIMAKHDFLGATKALLKLQGVDMGPLKSPGYNLSTEEIDDMVELLKLESFKELIL